MPRVVPMVLCLVATCLVEPVSRADAQADIDPEARALFERGVEAARGSRWEEAARLFAEADRRMANPNIRINLAAALVQTGRLVEARELYLRILEEHAGELADVEPAVREALGRVDSRLPRLEIVFEGMERGDVVRVDDEAVEVEDGRAVLRRDPGVYSLRLIRRGETFIARSVELTERQRASVTVVVRDAPAEGEEPVDGERLPTEPNWPAIATGLGGLAVAAAAIGPGIAVLDIQQDPRLRSYRVRTPVGQDACEQAANDTTAEGAEIVDLCGTGEALTVAEWVLIGVGSAVVLASAVWLAVQGFEVEIGSDVRAALAVGASSLSLRGSFP